MKNIFSKVFKLSKILIIFVIIFNLTTVNVTKENDKVTNENINKTLDLTAMAIKYDSMLMEDLYYPLDTYTGDLTGYAANCPLCSGKLGCTGQNVLDGTTTFTDSTYGNVRRVASSRNLACGSIVRFNANGISNEPIIAIVLDRGVVGNNLDLLVPSQEYAITNVGRRRTTYDVLRYGWSR